MDFFGFTPAEFNTPIGNLIKTATDPLLLGPDWAKNLEICDAVNASRDVAEAATKAILRRLQDTDTKVVSLTLVITETCMKNCGPVFVSTITKPFMDEMVNVAKGLRGTQNQDDSLRIIQQWGKAFQSNRSSLFYEAYASLKSRGFNFPPDEEPVMNILSTNKPERAPSPPRKSVENSKNDDVSKLKKDLGEVFERVRLCREMLPQSPGIQEDEALSEVIGYLEACRDRMVDLIEAGTQGLLEEDVLALCLRCNDAVLRTLDAEKNGSPIEVEDGLPPPNSSVDEDTKPSATTKSAAAAPAAMSTGLVDDFDDGFANLALKTSSRKPGAPAAKPKAIAPPPSGPGSHQVKLQPLQDLLTGDSPKTASPSKPSAPLGDDLDIFLTPAYSSVNPPPPPNDHISGAPSNTNTSTTTSGISDNDFDAFLDSIAK